MTSKKIQVIIPVIRTDLIGNLLDNIAENTVLPDCVIIIDNSEAGVNVTDSLRQSKYSIIRPPEPLMTNASWNLGISSLSECSFVSILNDDIEIPKTFFENLIEGFEVHADAGVICPNTTSDRRRVCKAQSRRFKRMGRREGWAFTVRKELLDKIPPIPNDLNLFFGDDWYWWYVYELGLRWYLDSHIMIYHGVGASIRSSYRNTWAKLQKKERKIWYKYEQKFRDGTI